MKKYRRYYRLGLMILSAALITACQTKPISWQSHARAILQRPSLTAADYLRQVKDAPADGKIQPMLLAARALLDENKNKQAYALIKQLQQAGTYRDEVNLLKAQWQVQTRRFKSAKALLLRMPVQAASEPQDQAIADRRLKLLAHAYRGLGQRLMGIKTEALQVDTRSSQARSQAIIVLWERLSHVRTATLKRWLTQVSPNSSTAAWLKLASIMSSDNMASKNWFEAITHWREQYPIHPGQELLPPKLDEDLQKEQLPRSIALLLPITGHYMKQGQAIRRGFYAAYYQYHQAHAKNTLAIHVFDTNSGNIPAIMQRALADGAGAIVGPLLKQNVSQLLAMGSPTVPVLALNTTNKIVSGVTQFALFPESKMDQLAIRMASNKKWRVAVLAPNTPRGSRLLQRFQTDWELYRGQIVGVFRYDRPAGYSAGVRRLLQLDRSYQRKRSVEKLLGKKVRFHAARRQDIDAFLVIGNRQAVQSFKPLLSFYFAADLPVYASSDLLAGLSGTTRLPDLNGVRFLSTPWQVAPRSGLSKPLGQLREQIQQLWPRMAHKYGLFYAMGVDAFFMLQRLPMLSSLVNSSYAGETGMISINEKQQALPMLMWAQWKKGFPTAHDSPLE